MSITVTVQTSKGDYTKESEVSSEAFSVSTPFDTHSSAGFFGERCKNRPKTVQFAVRTEEKLLLDQRFRFPEDFERDPASKFVYRLKQAIDIDAAGSSGTP